MRRAMPHDDDKRYYAARRAAQMARGIRSIRLLRANMTIAVMRRAGAMPYVAALPLHAP